MSVPTYSRYTSAGGVSITRQSRVCEGAQELEKRLQLLDSHPGVLLSCASEYPGRYQKRDLLLVNPPIQISARHHQLKIRALNARGEIPLPTFYEALQSLAQVSLSVVDTVIVASPTASYAGGSRSGAARSGDYEPEEMRTRRPGCRPLRRCAIRPCQMQVHRQSRCVH